MPGPDARTVRGRLLVTFAGAILLPGCGERSAVRQESSQGESFSAPADSLVLTSATGTQVWLTLSRPATSAAGQPCVERGLEIRRNGKRVKVPLLYTGNAPVLVNDSTMRAILWTHCRAGDTYLVNLRTGHPLRDPADRP